MPFIFSWKDGEIVFLLSVVYGDMSVRYPRGVEHDSMKALQRRVSNGKTAVKTNTFEAILLFINCVSCDHSAYTNITKSFYLSGDPTAHLRLANIQESRERVDSCTPP